MNRLPGRRFALNVKVYFLKVIKFRMSSATILLSALSQIKKNVTDRRTDERTCQKQYSPQTGDKKKLVDFLGDLIRPLKVLNDNVTNVG